MIPSRIDSLTWMQQLTGGLERLPGCTEFEAMLDPQLQTPAYQPIDEQRTKLETLPP